MVGSPAGNNVAENFSSSRGDMMAAKDFKDEGGVVEVRYDH